jgi:hypothetical protein
MFIFSLRECENLYKHLPDVWLQNEQRIFKTLFQTKSNNFDNFQPIFYHLALNVILLKSGISPDKIEKGEDRQNQCLLSPFKRLQNHPEPSL